jgi:hypothetical protein
MVVYFIQLNLASGIRFVCPFENYSLFESYVELGPKAVSM